MSQNYAAVFLYENIDGGVLLEMTDDDLKSVGVSKFGDRMVLVQAIGRLKEDLSDCQSDGMQDLLSKKIECYTQMQYENV